MLLEFTRAKDNSIARLKIKGQCDVMPEGYVTVCSLGLKVSMSARDNETCKKAFHFQNMLMITDYIIFLL